MDIELSAVPLLNDNAYSRLYQYLRNMSNDSAFDTSVLQISIEERCAAYCNRWNSKRSIHAYKVVDVVKAHVQINSNADKGFV